MRQALGEAVAPSRARPTPKPNPSGPVQPQDVPEIGDIPLGDDGSRLRVRDNGVVISTDVEGVPLDLRIDRDGLALEPSEPRPTPSATPPAR
jgi:penicillin-binding protein 1A